MHKLTGILFGLLLPVATMAETVTVTSPSPTEGQLITNGCIRVYAAAQSDVGARITGWRIYVDRKAAFKAVDTARINTTICVPSVSIGTHNVYARAWSANGSFGDSTAVNVTISGVYKIVAPGDEALSPATGQSFNNGLIRVAMSAYSPYPLTKWMVYVDGKRAFTSYQGAIQVKTYLEVPLGTHRVTVHVWDVNQVMASYRATDVVVTKDPMNIQPFVKPPSTAITLRNLDDEGTVHWKAPKTGGVASCRSTDLVCIAKAPLAVASPVQFVTTPSPLPIASDGMGALFETLTGTEPYGNALYGSSIFFNDPSRVNFVSDMWVMLTSTNIQTLELDLWVTAGGDNFMMGTQCNFAQGKWDFGDATPENAHWRHVSPTAQNNDLVCNLKPYQWAHLRFHMFRDATSYHFVSLEIDGVNHSLSELAAALPGLPRPYRSDGTSFQVQLDSNASATPFQVYIDNFNITRW